jgi:magnesium transporter
VLTAISTVPREEFVQESGIHQAWENRALPIEEGQTISQPLIVGLMSQLLSLSGTERVLEIGTWHAGTTETLARALWETKQGHIDTIDPFGGERCPPIIASFPPERTVGETIEELRELVTRALITYVYVLDAKEHLLGIVTMRDLLFSDRQRTLEQVMLRGAFALHASVDIKDAMRLVLDRHYPVYPVVDAERRLIGLVRGQAMFEAQAIEISLQAGSMVGVEKEERLATPWIHSLKLRHPWLQLNLLTAFLAAAVVGLFQDTVDRLVILALFLPVLAGQSGNTGCQALAVTLRGMTLGELRPGSERRLVTKEAWLGCLNGIGVGLAAGIGMFVTAAGQHAERPFMLAFAVFLAMIGACIASGVSGAMVPLTLKRLGFDPATASSIFLTTATDVVSMGMLLGLATILVL